MRVILALGLAFWLTGCVLKPAPKAVASTPVAPKPMPAPPKPPPAPPEPLSSPQTQFELPAPQPLSQEAIASAQLPEESAAPAPPPKRKGRSGAPGSVAARPEGPKPEPARTEPAKPEPAAPAAAPPQIRAIVPQEELQQYKQRADEIRRETQQRIAHLQGQNLTDINTFLKQSQEAEKRGDMRGAYEFADKALTLAKVLTGGR